MIDIVKAKKIAEKKYPKYKAIEAVIFQGKYVFIMTGKNVKPEDYDKVMDNLFITVDDDGKDSVFLLQQNIDEFSKAAKQNKVKL